MYHLYHFIISISRSCYQLLCPSDSSVLHSKQGDGEQRGNGGGECCQQFTADYQIVPCKEIGWRSLSVCKLPKALRNCTVFTVIICRIAIAQHGTNYQISFFVCVCMYVCLCGHAYGHIFQLILTKFGKILWGLNRKN